LVKLGREGYRAYAEEIFATADQMMAIVRSHPELRIMGSPTFCFSFTSDDFDIYHVADFMRPLGWRFNGQQYPNAIHMAVTRPQTQEGVVEAFARDLAAAVEYARERHAAGEQALSGAVYGGVPGGLEGLTEDVEEFIVQMMDAMLDAQTALPPA
jgi:sphinganine-1-phosphate aldolase